MPGHPPSARTSMYCHPFDRGKAAFSLTLIGLRTKGSAVSVTTTEEADPSLRKADLCSKLSLAAERGMTVLKKQR